MVEKKEVQVKEVQANQMWVVLKVANEIRSVAKQTLNNLLTYHVLAIPGAIYIDEATKKEIKSLQNQLKVQQDMLTHMFLEKENERNEKIVALQENLDATEREAAIQEATTSLPIPEPLQEGSDFGFLEGQEEEIPLREEVHEEEEARPLDDLSQVERELTEFTAQEIEPI